MYRKRERKLAKNLLLFILFSIISIQISSCSFYLIPEIKAYRNKQKMKRDAEHQREERLWKKVEEIKGSGAPDRH
jgi:hypothetical protein